MKTDKRAQRRIARALAGFLANGTGPDLLGLANEIVAEGNLWKTDDPKVGAISDALTTLGLERNKLEQGREGLQRIGEVAYRPQPGLRVDKAKTRSGDGTWVDGLVNSQRFQALVFDTGSEHGIGEGRISKLWVRAENGDILISYDRGWDIRARLPEAGEALKTLLEAFA